MNTQLTPRERLAAQLAGVVMVFGGFLVVAAPGSDAAGYGMLVLLAGSVVLIVVGVRRSRRRAAAAKVLRTAPPGTKLPPADPPSALEGAAVAVQGANGWLGLYEGHVRLVKSGFRAMVGVGYGAGTKDIALSQISAIQWRDAGDLWLGYIAFSFLGGSDSSGGVFDAAKSDNAITFEKLQQAEFASVRSAIQGRLGGRAPVVSAATGGVADQIRELASLRDGELITPEEFEAKKAELLKRM